MACCLHFTQRSFNRESSKQAAINAVLLDCHNFVLCTYIYEYFSSLRAKKKKKKSSGSISFLHSSRCQTCVFTRPSAFQSLFLAQMIILLFLDAYPPCLCLGLYILGGPSHEAFLNHALCLGNFFPHICGLNRFF